jgi:hypothetical protein
MPETMQKESAQSDHPAQRKRPEWCPILLIWANTKISQYFGIPIFRHILDVFSQQGGPIELVPFALGQASLDTSVEYPQLFLEHRKSIFVRVDPLVGPVKLVFNEKNEYFLFLSYI